MGQLTYTGFLYIQNKKQGKKNATVIMKTVKIIAKTKLPHKIKNHATKTLKMTPIETMYKRRTVLEMSKWKDKWNILLQK